MSKTILRILVNTLIGIVLIYFWFKLVNISEVLAAISKVNLIIIVPIFLLMIFTSISKALRLKLLLSKYKIPSLKIIFLTLLSQLLSFTIPIRAGEITKAVYLGTEYRIPFGKALIWIFIDRFLDFWMTIVLTFILLILIPTNLPQNLIYSLAVLVALFSLSVIFILIAPDYFRKIVKFFSHLLILSSLKKIVAQLLEFVIEAVHLLKQGAKQNFLIFLLTFFGIAFESLCWLILLTAFTYPTPYFKVLLGSMLNALTFIFPAAPGYVGSAEAAGLAVFSYGLSFDKISSSASTVIYHAVSLIYILTAGILGLYFLKFNLNLVWRKITKK